MFEARHGWHLVTIVALIAAVAVSRRAYSTRIFQSAIWGVLLLLWVGTYCVGLPLVGIYSSYAFAVRPLPVESIAVAFIGLAAGGAWLLHVKRRVSQEED